MVARADILAGRAVIFIDIQDTIDKQLRSIRNKMRMFSSSIAEVGADMFRGGLAATAGSIFPVKDFINFQDQMLFLQTKLQVTDEAMKPLEKTIRQLGMTTSFSSKEVGQAATMYAQAGFTLLEVQDSLQAALDLSRGGQVDLTTSTTILSNALRTFQKDASNAADFASKFITAARLGTLDIIDLGESLKYSSGTFANFGVSIEEVLGLITTLANSGLKASLAGTSLNTAFLNMASNAPKLKELLNVTLLEEDFKNPLQALKKLENGLRQFSKIEQAGILQDLVNIRGGRAIQGLLLQGLDKVDANIRAVTKSTDEARTAAIKLDSALGGVWRRGVSAFQELSIAIGATSEGPLTAFGERVTSIANNISSLTKENTKLVQTFLFMGPALLVAGAGLLTINMILGKMAMLITPMMMLNSALFNIAANIAGLHVRALSSLGGGVKSLALGMVGKQDTKYIDNLAVFNKKVEILEKKKTKTLVQLQLDRVNRQNELDALRTATSTKYQNDLTSAQQRTQSRSANLDRKFAQERTLMEARVQERMDAAFQTSLQARVRNEEALRAIQASSLQVQTQSGDRLLEIQGKLDRVALQRVKAEKANQVLLTTLRREQETQRTTLSQENQKKLDAIEADRDNLIKKQQRRQEIQARIDAIQNRSNKVKVANDKLLTIATRRQLEERQALFNANNAKLAAMETALPAKPASGLSGVMSRTDKASVAAYEKAHDDLMTTMRKMGEDEIKLTQKHAKELTTLQAKRTTELAPSRKAELSLQKMQVKAIEAIQQEEMRLYTVYVKAKTMAADELVRLEAKQAKELARFQAARTANVERINKVELRIAKQQKAVMEELAAARQKFSQQAIALEQKLLLEREATASAMMPAEQQQMFESQAAQRRALAEKAAVDEQKIVARNRKKIVSINKAAQAVEVKEAAKASTAVATIKQRLDKLSAPQDTSSFLTKNRGAGLGAGLLGAAVDIGRTIKGAFSGISFRNLWKSLDVVNLLYKGFRSIWTVTKGIGSILNMMRRTLFSLSGWLTIVEVLILFGDKIPVVKDILEGLGTAFSNLFKNIGETLRNLGPSFGLLYRGLNDIFGGKIEQGIVRARDAFRDMGNTISTGLTAAWSKFVSDIKPGADIIKAIIVGTISTIQALGAAIGGVLGTAFQTGEILITGDSSLVETLQKTFSPENIKAFFAAIIGAIESIGLGLISLTAMIGNTLIKIQSVFMAILKGLANLPVFSEAASAGLAAMQEPTGPNADEIKLLRKRLKNLTTDLNTMNPFHLSASTRKNLEAQYAEVVARLGELGDSMVTDIIPTINTDELAKELKDKIAKLMEGLTNAVPTAPTPEKDAEVAAIVARRAKARATTASIMDDTIPGLKSVGSFIGEALGNLKVGDIPSDAMSDASDAALDSLSTEDLITKFATKTESGKKLIEKIGKEIDTNNPLQWLLDSGYFYADEDVAELSPEALIKKSKQREFALGVLGKPDLLGWGGEVQDLEEKELGELFNKVQGMSMDDFKAEASGLWAGFKVATGIDPKALKGAVAPQQEQVAGLSSVIGKALVGTFQSTRGNTLQMVPRMEKLQEEANKLQDDNNGLLEELVGTKQPFVFVA
jgi:TP901 family phage tail tape measure protein